MRIVLGAIVCLAVLIALGSYRYLLDSVPIPPSIAANRFHRFWLVAHAGFAATALLIGGFQFSRSLRNARPAVHRIVGRVYVACCLLGAIAGFVLAMGSSAGPIASLGFGLLAIGWLTTTAIAWQRARTRRFIAHRQWMIRSWALTLSAVTLRLYMPLADVMGLPGLEAYRAISFLCWVPNLIVAELIVRRIRPG